MENKFKFPSEESIRAFKDELNKNKAYEEAAKDWEGDFLFIATPDQLPSPFRSLLGCKLASLFSLIPN